MFLLEGRLIWTASDLTAAAECEYALLPRMPTPYSTAALKAADEATQAAFRERPKVERQLGDSSPLGLPLQSDQLLKEKM
jgi:hypothetical protein